ncbi:MAG: copper amine oxidase N-terminal domain-containing protein [Clostridia bacterium]|nr:copper amine oxidase N-terminal domain-containing protein [Clostridia bacterium]
MRKIICFIVCICMLSSLPVNAQDNSYDSVEIKLSIGDNTVYINGVPTVIDAAPVIRNDRTMVPIRVIAEALGAEVEWTTWLMRDAVNIIPNNEFYRYCIVIGESEVIVWKDPFHEKFDPDLEINNSLDSPAFIENDRTYLPLRFVAEGLGASVGWDGATQTITIVK